LIKDTSNNKLSVPESCKNDEKNAGSVKMKDVKLGHETLTANVKIKDVKSDGKTKQESDAEKVKFKEAKSEQKLKSVGECKELDSDEVKLNENNKILVKEISPIQDNHLADTSAKIVINAETPTEVKYTVDTNKTDDTKKNPTKAENFEASDVNEQEKKDIKVDVKSTAVMCSKKEQYSETAKQTKHLEETKSKGNNLKEQLSEPKELASKERIGLVKLENVEKSSTEDKMEKKDSIKASIEHKQVKDSLDTKDDFVSNIGKENKTIFKENTAKDTFHEGSLNYQKEKSTVKQKEESVVNNLKEGNINKPKEGSVNNHKDNSVKKNTEGSVNNHNEGSVNKHKEGNVNNLKEVSVRENSSVSKSSDHSTSHRSKHHKHQHRDKTGTKPSSSHDSKSNRHEHNKNDSKSDHSHHKKSSSHQKSSSSDTSQRSSSSNTQKTMSSTPQKSEPRSKTDHSVKTVSKDSSERSPHKEAKAISKDPQKSEAVSNINKSESSSSDKHRSHHRKKRIVNCGVQVNLRKKTDTKSSQVPEDIGGVSSSKVIESQKLSDKKLQRIAYVQQSMNNVQKGGKHAKPTPRTGLEHLGEAMEQNNDQVFSEFSSESQGNKFWKTQVASIEKYKYKKLMHVEKYSNGGGLILHAYQNEVDKLSDTEKVEFAQEFMDFTYGEPNEGVANCCISVVHGAISQMPDLIEHFADTYPNLTVKAGVLGKSDIETMTMEKYREQLHKSFSAGTFRCGPLLQVSVVGTAQEEVGDYFPEVLDMFESDPFLNLVMPWGELSSVRMASRNMSNDGPILWTRPGEQLVPTADMPKSPFKRKR
jgi:hypothetical protein